MSQQSPKSGVGGVDAVIEMLNHMDGPDRQRLLSGIAQRDPALAQRIEAGLFNFRHLVELEDAAIQLLLREVPSSTLALALRGEGDGVRGPLFRNLSSRAAQALREEIDALGPRKLSDVRIAQDQVLGIARKLERAGKLQLTRKPE